MSVVTAWGRAAYDTRRNAFVFNGGGQDNTPVSAHTYDGLEYLPNVDRIFRNGGSEWRNGKNYDRSAYDRVRGTVYVVGNVHGDEYDSIRDTPHGNVWVWKSAAVSAGDSTSPPPEPEPVVKPLLEHLQPGQTVTLPPGIYREAAVVSASDVVMKAHGVRLENAVIEGKAALVIKGDNVTIEGLECSGISVAAGNGACVRLEAKDLTLRQVWFRDSQSGLLSWNRDSGTVLIEDSRFERLGSESEQRGQAHGVYIGRGTTHLIIRNSQFLSSTGEGHEIKSRAAKNTIERNVIASLDGVDSRLVDLPEGGENLIRRNVLAKGPASSNPDLIGVALEGQRFLHPRSSTMIEENIIIMERSGSNVLLQERYVPAARIERNTVIGGKPPGGNNTWFPDRAAAGLANYPILPQAH